MKASERPRSTAPTTRKWRKVHFGLDATTLETRVIEVPDNGTGDAPMLPRLLEQIADDEMIASVSGDSANDTKSCREAITHCGAQAINSTRKNAKPWTGVPVPKPGMLFWTPRAVLGGNLEEVGRLSSAQPC